MVGVFLVACGGGGTAPRLPTDPITHSELAEDDPFVPSYGKSEVQKALITERALEATGETLLAELEGKPDTAASQDQRRVAAADLAVRRRFIASLEACEARGDWCPPRLDDPAWNYDYDGADLDSPPLDAELRFDADGWRSIASELHARSCACRTMLCVDSVGVAIDRLERRPAPAVRGDEVASQSITRARECLFRLRGTSVRTRTLGLVRDARAVWQACRATETRSRPLLRSRP